MLQEIIVVEGWHDAAAVKRAVEAEVIITSGYAIAPATFQRIALAQERCGVVVLTDPDFAGEQIRQRIDAKVPGCRHAFLAKAAATKNNDVGVENASPQAIRAALEQAQVRGREKESTASYGLPDLLEAELVGSPRAAARRRALGEALGVGYASAKTFCQRLNAFNIPRARFAQLVANLREDDPCRK